ncbi:hypothetical protein CSE45_1234 [Citreicella sp. SE45]|nr:hypothetical protein CSE45_1234 [Citreicella sp. SE45]
MRRGGKLQIRSSRHPGLASAINQAEAGHIKIGPSGHAIVPCRGRRGK